MVINSLLPKIMTLNKCRPSKHGSSDGRAVELESGDPGFESHRF